MGSGSSGARHNLIIDAGAGLTLNVEVSGDGAPILLLHGFTGSTATWDDLRSGLEAGNRVVAVDLPGHGKSSSPQDSDRYSLSRLSDDLDRVLDYIGIDKAIVAGYSMGGRAALRFALNKPQRVSALVLESTSPGLDSEGEREKRRLADEELAGLVEREGIEAFVKLWETLPIWATQKSLPHEKIQTLRRQRLKGNTAGLANSLRGAGTGADDSVAARLHEIHVPVLLIAGELDTKYVRIMSAMHAAISASKLVIVEGAGHAVHLEKPEVFAREVGDFVKRVNDV